MTKQEGIREGMARRLPLKGTGQPDFVLADILIEYQHSRDVVIKGDSLGGSHPHLANYYTVEPLIKDEMKGVKE